MTTEEQAFLDKLRAAVDQPTGRYLEIDCFSNAHDYLKKAEAFLSDGQDPFRWKWAAIALSSALYGFMIRALERGNYHNVIDFSKMKKKDKHNPEKAKLISFGEAFSRVQDPRQMEPNAFSKEVNLSQTQKKNVLRLRQFYRNLFEHYKPTLWLIPEETFPPLLRDTCWAIQQVLDSNNVRADDGSQVKGSTLWKELCDLVKHIIKLIDDEEAHLADEQKKPG